MELSAAGENALIESADRSSTKDSPSSSPLSSLAASSGPPSSPLSVLSNSPSLPSSPLQFDASRRYPSPSSTDMALSGCASPLKPQDGAPTPPQSQPPSSSAPSKPHEICVRTDGPPPAKRRRTQPSTPKKPRVRTTEYLDLEKTNDNGYQDELLKRLMTVLQKKKRIVVVAGAGISVSAGIPDFRSSTGLFTTLRGQHKLKASGKHLFDASVYKDDSSTSSFHTMVKELAALTEQAEPTPFHHMLASIAQEGRLMRLYTQNIDCLDTGMKPLETRVPLGCKGPWPTTIQLHGGLAKMVCTKCGELQAFDAKRFDGPEPPPCPQCEETDAIRTTFGGKRSHGVGRLRPRIVLYNEDNPDSEAIGNVSNADLRRLPDAVVVVGTSLKIPGVRRLVREMCKGTRSRRDGFTAWINVDPEPPGAEFKDCWDVVVKARCDDVAQLVNLPRWDQQGELAEDDKSWEVTAGAEEARQRHHSKDPVVNIVPPDPALLLPAEAKSKLVEQLVEQANGGIPTPSASPRLGSVLPATKASTTSSSSVPKQSLLSFGDKKRSRKDEDSTTASNKSTSKAKKPRQTAKKAAPKKEPKAGADLTKTFKATKARSSVGAPAGKTKAAKGLNIFKKGQQPSPGLSSPISFVEDQTQLLPSLRPSRPPEPTAPTPLKSVEMTSPRPSSSPSIFTTPPSQPRSHERRASADTISPTSIPRSMVHLID